jgi:polyisoprenoid-binding protein YceI
LHVKIQAASANSGSGMKYGKLKSKDFFDVEHDPLITYHSTKVTQTGPNTVAYDGDFTIRRAGAAEAMDDWFSCEQFMVRCRPRQY